VPAPWLLASVARQVMAGVAVGRGVLAHVAEGHAAQGRPVVGEARGTGQGEYAGTGIEGAADAILIEQGQEIARGEATADARRGTGHLGVVAVGEGEGEDTCFGDVIGGDACAGGGGRQGVAEGQAGSDGYPGPGHLAVVRVAEGEGCLSPWARHGRCSSRWRPQSWTARRSRGGCPAASRWSGRSLAGSWR